MIATLRLEAAYANAGMFQQLAKEKYAHARLIRDEYMTPSRATHYTARYIKVMEDAAMYARFANEERELIQEAFYA